MKLITKEIRNNAINVIQQKHKAGVAEKAALTNV